MRHRDTFLAMTSVLAVTFVIPWNAIKLGRWSKVEDNQRVIFKQRLDNASGAFPSDEFESPNKTEEPEPMTTEKRLTSRSEQQGNFSTSPGLKKAPSKTSGQAKGIRQVFTTSAAYLEAVKEAREKASSVVVLEGRDPVQDAERAAFKSRFCRDILFLKNRTIGSTRDKPTLLNFTFSARDIFNAPGGTGNYLFAIYSWRVVARVLGNVDVIIHVTDAVQQSRHLILPWVAGYFPESSKPAPASVPRPSRDHACNHFGYHLMHFMLEEIRFDLRRMAISMLGIPGPEHASQQFAEKYLWGNSPHSRTVQHTMQFSDPPEGFVPLYPDVGIDDALLHFRCGDFIRAQNPHFGFIKFWDYARHISPEARSIGIVTQPFDFKGTQVRPKDRVPRDASRCRIVVTSLVEYLQELHPNATISIYNDANETIALTYARMIMANQTIVGLGTFGFLGALATFGPGYILNYNGAPSQFQTSLEMFTNDTVLFDTKHSLSSQRLQQMWKRDEGASVLEWFRNKDIE